MDKYEVIYRNCFRKMKYDDRIDDVMKSYLTDIKKISERDYRYSYIVFLIIDDYNVQNKITLNKWKKTDYKKFFEFVKPIDDKAMDICFIYLNKFFDYCEENNVKKYMNSKTIFISTDINFENAAPVITHNDFITVLKTLKATDMSRKNSAISYYVAMFSLLYYGISIYDLHEYTYEDFQNGKYLYKKIEDSYILQCIEISKNITVFKNMNVTYLDNSNPDVICKPTTYQTRNQCMQQYRKRLYTGLNAIRHRYKISSTALNRSGALYFFVRDCIEENLEIYSDLLISRMTSDRRKKYDELAKKYRLNFSTIKVRYRDWVLKIYNEIKEGEEM